MESNGYLLNSNGLWKLNHNFGPFADHKGEKSFFSKKLKIWTKQSKNFILGLTPSRIMCAASVSRILEYLSNWTQ